MNLVKGGGEVYPRPGRSFDPTLIPKAIQDAGFTAAEVLVSVDGTLVQGREFLELDVPGLKGPFVLEGGTQANALKKRSDLRGKRVRVTGKLHPGHADLPPGLTIEQFQPGP